MPNRVDSGVSHLLIVKPNGPCDLAGSLAMLRSLGRQKGSHAVAGALLDLRRTDYSPTFRDVQALAEEAGRAVHMPLALVVDGTLQTGIAHQFAVFAEGLGIRVGVFTDPTAATDWLTND